MCLTRVIIMILVHAGYYATSPPLDDTFDSHIDELTDILE